MNTMISIQANLHEDLHSALLSYLDTHPDWDQDRVLSASLSLFLMQYGSSDRRLTQVYLNSLFSKALPTAC